MMTDLTSIGTLFAFAIVCGGVLLFPPREKGEKRFNLPYINGQWIVALFFIVFLYGFRDQFVDE